MPIFLEKAQNPENPKIPRKFPRITKKLNILKNMAF